MKYDRSSGQARWSLRPVIGSVQLSALTTLYVLAVANNTFWARAYGYLSVSPSAFAGFVLGIAAAIFALLTMFSVKYLIKPVLIAFIFIAVTAAWFTDQYGVVIDKEMIRNAAVTTSAESHHLLTPGLFVHLFLTGVLPALFIIWVRVRHHGFLRKIVWNTVAITSCLAVFIGAGFASYQTYAAVGRLHRDMMMTLNPVIPIASVVRYAMSSERDKNIVRTPLGLDARQRAASATGKPRVTIIVAGETARADNFSLNGYARETNPEMKARGVVYYPNATSCGTSTAVSIPCMFSAYTRKQYSHSKGIATDNLLDILVRAGVKAEWWDNDTGSYGVADRIHYRFLPDSADPRFCREGECLDTILLDRLDNWLADVKQDSVLVLHQLGSHGPAYYQRYPEDFRRFTPDCRTAEFGACKPEEIVNAYDNTILFTDHVVGGVIDALKRHEGAVSASMIYLSDHGESLGENGIYLHGAPYFVAPSQQTHVPIALWFAPDFSKAASIDTACLQTDAKRAVSHDNLFHSVLGLMDVATNVYDRSLDLLTPCRKSGDNVAMD